MLLLYPADVLARRRPDAAYAEEVAAGDALDLEHALIRLEVLIDEDDAERAVVSVPESDTPVLGLYRGWMMRPPQYVRLYDALADRGIRLINDAGAYAATHLLPESYGMIAKMTPRTVWIPLVPGSPLPDWGVLGELLRPFGDQPLIVKDYVKSRKHEWAEACFIPSAADPTTVERVTRRFVELQGPDLEGGLVFREFVEFAPIGAHPQSGMPLTREYRIFWLDGHPLAVAPYWDQQDEAGDPPPVETFAPLAASIGSRFFTMDVAQRQDTGAWQIVELGDAQVAGLPEQLDVHAFYARVKAALVPREEGGA